MRRPPLGMTLLEVTLYIGLLAVVLPGSVLFLLRMRDAQQSYDARIRMEQMAAVILSELNTQLTTAESIAVSTSTLNATQSALHFVNASGSSVVIDAPITTSTFTQGNQDVHRLRMQIGNSDPMYLTDPDMEIAEWRAQEIRDTNGTLTGLRLHLDMEMLHAGTRAYRQSRFTADTTIDLADHTIEN